MQVSVALFGVTGAADEHFMQVSVVFFVLQVPLMSILCRSPQCFLFQEPLMITTKRNASSGLEHAIKQDNHETLCKQWFGA